RRRACAVRRAAGARRARRRDDRRGAAVGHARRGRGDRRSFAPRRRTARGWDMSGAPRVGIIMGSKSDWATMKHAADTLDELGVPHESKIVSAHRTPDRLFEYASSAAERGLHVIIAGAGGAAHLPGMCASKTHLPVLGVPVQSKVL